MAECFSSIVAAPLALIRFVSNKPNELLIRFET